MTRITTNWSILNFPVYRGGGGSQCSQGVSVYFSYGIPETVERAHHGESFYIVEIKIIGWVMPCRACSHVIIGLISDLISVFP